MILKLKPLLGISKDDNSKDILLEFSIESAGEIIKNHCKLEEVPEGLSNTLLRMARDLYRSEGLGEEETPVGPVSSITEGDTSISFRSPSEEFKNTLIKDYKKSMARYRRLVW